MISLHRIPLEKSHEIGVLLLNLPESANALNADLIAELTTCFKDLREDPDLRCLVVSGKGQNFCAGADLKWMRSASKLSFDENVEDAQRLSDMFESLTELSIPTVALTHGSVFGGGVGLAAACDFVFAVEGTKFCLSEAKLGLLPAIIAPYLGRKMHGGFLNRAALSARLFSAEEAVFGGLVEKVLARADLDEALTQEINQILLCGPKAQATIKKLFASLSKSNWQQSEETAETIAKLRVGIEGQEGMRAFFDKSPAPWVMALKEPLSLTKLLWS